MIRDRRHELRKLTIERCCQVLEVSRSEYYARLTPQLPPLPDPLLDETLKEAELRPAYGYRRIGASLRKRGNTFATNKRIRFRMQQLGLNRRKKRRKTRTSIPGKGPSSPNLAGDLKLTGPRQLLVTDLTYVALPHGFAYVSVILDAYSRRALGWAVSDSLATELPLEALDMALQASDLPKGWIHHSDRGCQYTSTEYRKKVIDSHGLLSNSKPACPYDNAKMESFFKTYKYEEANLQSFLNLEDLKLNLSTFLKDYNSSRLHSALGYCSPNEFESNHNSTKQMCVR